MADTARYGEIEKAMTDVKCLKCSIVGGIDRIMTLSPEELNEIEARLNAATPGPWKRETERGTMFSRIIAGSEVNEFHPLLKLQVCEASLAGPGYAGDQTKRACNNAEFIANAPTDIRKLIDEVKALRERFLCEHDIPKHIFCVECRL